MPPQNREYRRSLGARKRGSNVHKRFETHFDTTEETEIVLVPLADTPDLIRREQITHALVVVAFHWYGLLTK